MYAAVHDAAKVSERALARFLTSKNGKDIIAAHEVDKSCPLRSIESKDKGLGQKILSEIKKVCLGCYKIDSLIAKRKLHAKLIGIRAHRCHGI